MRFTTLNEWLAWFEQLHPTEIELGLERIAEVAARMELSKPARRVVSVAGTNGKGSTVAALESVFVAAKISVGSYTSPHLLDYNERIKINGVPVGDGIICQAFSRIDQARGEISLSYFEFGTLAALAIFADSSLELALLEVGLGGRLDAVNIIDADIAVITRIDIDHVDWLGSDRETIAVEKGGIMRPAIPVVCADSEPPASLIAMARQLGCLWYQYGVDYSLEDTPNSSLSSAWRWCSEGENQSIEGFSNRSLPQPSLAAAIQVVSLLDCPVSADQLRQGINHAALAGRLQKFMVDEQEVLLDVAHNSAAAHYLTDYLQTHAVEGNTVAVFAAMADKDIAGITAEIKTQIDLWCLASLSVSRAAKASELGKLLQQQGITAITMSDSVEEAYIQAKSLCNKRGRILVFGSFYTVSEVLQQLNLQ